MAPRARNGQEERAPRVTLIVLAALGLGISAYLTWTHFLGVPPMCISGSGRCETVQSSRYAAIFGVPVAALGAVAYAGLLFSATLRGEAGIYLGLLISLVGTLFSFYLTYLEVFVIHALCQWCLASAAIMVGALVCVALRVRLLTQAR
jgi:uncharacterized membrane protein